MTEVRYISSNKKEYNLISDRIRPTNGSFHEYEWTPKVVKQENGDVVSGFEKGSKKYQITFTIRGPISERKSMIDEITNEFESDIINKHPGRMYFGNWYIDCYIIEKTTGISGTYNNWTEISVSIYCQYPFWISETAYNFYSYDTALSSNNKNYPGRYPYRYANGLSNAYIQNPHFTDANFDLIIYGPAVNPQVTIGETPYLVNIVLEEGEYLKIDSRAGTVTKVMANGEIVNAFHNRQKGRQFFKKIPPGRHSVSWPGTFAWDIIIYEERSEPKWNVSQQQ